MNAVNEPRIQVYILSRNRLESLLQTLDTALRLDYSNFEVIVSDNSTNELVAEGLKDHPQKDRFRFIRRPPLDLFNKHMNLIYSEVTAPYLIIFHDDDQFMPNCLKVYAEIMEKNPQVGACAGNTKMIYRGEKSDDLYYHSTQDQLMQNENEFVERYYGRSHGHPPFPFYMYRSSVVRDLPVIYEQGLIHSDGAFLFRIMKKSALYWSASVVGYYHLHDTNISRFINLRALNSLYHFFKARMGDPQQIVYRYKWRNRVRYYIQNRKKILEWLSDRRQRILFFKTIGFFLSNLNFYFQKLLKKRNP